MSFPSSYVYGNDLIQRTFRIREIFAQYVNVEREKVGKPQKISSQTFVNSRIKSILRRGKENRIVMTTIYNDVGTKLKIE